MGAHLMLRKRQDEDAFCMDSGGGVRVHPDGLAGVGADNGRWDSGGLVRAPG